MSASDYQVQTQATNKAPKLVHFFADWLSAEGMEQAASNPDQDVPPQPIEELDFELIDQLFAEDTVIAISWAMPLPFVDVPAEAYPNVPNVAWLLDGEYLNYIRLFARKVGSMKSQVMLNMYGEFDNNAFYSFGPNGISAFKEDPGVDDSDFNIATEFSRNYGDPNVPDGPDRVRDSIKRVIDIFRDEGVEVSWFMYASSGFMNKRPTEEQKPFWNRPEHYYPGDDYIEWVGKSVHITSYAEFRNKFELAYSSWGEVTKRPFFIAEQSVISEDNAVSRARDLELIFKDYLPRFPRVKAFATVHIAPGFDDLGFGFTPLGGSQGNLTDELSAWINSVTKNPVWQGIDL